MREMLRELYRREQSGQPALTYTATVGGFGKDKRTSSKLQGHVVLTDVTGPDGRSVTDHVWLPHTHEFNEMAAGDRIQFTAPVQPYFKLQGKGLMGEVPNTEMDYGFRRPYMVQKHAGKSEGDKDWKTRPGVRAVVLNEDGQVLLLKRPKTEEFHPDTWNLPGGAKERDEHHLEGAHRELKEETGLTATEHGQSHTFHFPGGQGKAYLMRDPKGKLKVAPREVAEARWFDPEKLPAKLFPQTESIVEALTKKAMYSPYRAYLEGINTP